MLTIHGTPLLLLFRALIKCETKQRREEMFYGLLNISQLRSLQEKAIYANNHSFSRVLEHDEPTEEIPFVNK